MNNIPENVTRGPGDDSDVEAGRCCPHCRYHLREHNVTVWTAGYSVATRHHADEFERVQAAHRALEVERDRLARWKAGALPIIAGLQEVGRALGIRLGERITGRVAVDAALDLRNERNAAQAEAAELHERIATARAVVSGRRPCRVASCEWDERGTNAGAGQAACMTPGGTTPGCLIGVMPVDGDDTDGDLRAVLEALDGSAQP